MIQLMIDFDHGSLDVVVDDDDDGVMDVVVEDNELLMYLKVEESLNKVAAFPEK